MSPSVLRCQVKASDVLELELQAVVRHLIVLGTENLSHISSLELHYLLSYLRYYIFVICSTISEHG